MRFSKIFDRIPILLLLTAIGMVLFYFMQFYWLHPICIFDEAVYAHNSTAMAENHEWMRYYYMGEVSHYNSKPPLVIWFQVISIWIFGHNEMAIRMPTYIALLGMLMMVFQFCRHHFKSIEIGILACFICLTTIGLIRPHVFLTGDLDGILVFFTTAIFLLLLAELKTNSFSTRFYVQMFLLFLIGYFVKSTAIFLIIPSLMVLMLKSGRVKQFIWNRNFAFGSLFFISIVTIYYFFREQYNPGHFSVVWQSEYLRFSEVVMDWHVHPFTYYFKNIAFVENSPYTWLNLILLPIYLFLKKVKHKEIVIQIFVLILIYLLFISIPKVKLEWYSAPIYTIWAIGLSIIVIEIFQAYFKSNASLKYLIVGIGIFVSACLTYETTSYLKTQTQTLNEFEKSAKWIQISKDEPTLKHSKILMPYSIHDDVIYLYLNSFKNHEGATLIRYGSINEVKPHDTCFVSNLAQFDSLNVKFDLDVLKEYSFGKVVTSSFVKMNKQ